MDDYNPFFIPHQAPSNYHLFGALKKEVKGQLFSTDKRVKQGVYNCVNKTGMHALIYRSTVGYEKH